jgi:protein-S-isoprenylcysteine O-methyltransferase Ste14
MLKLKVPPALVFLFFGGLMFLLAKWLPVGHFDFFGRKALIWILAGLGVLIGFVAVAQFFRAGTTLDPAHPEKNTKLVVHGIYTFSRNPMYLGLLLLLLSWGLYLGNAFNTLVAALFVAYMNRFQILAEEEILEKKHGSAYRSYCTLVRRWF